MDKRQPTDQQMMRERAVYRYLEALETGDIDAVMEVLEQATYDAQLEQMLLDSHEVYFQEEAPEQAALANIETQAEPLLLAQATLRSGSHQPQKSKYRVARWMQVLVATLILGILVGTFIDVIALHRPGNSHPTGKPTPAPAIPACKPYPWQTMDAHVEGDSLNGVDAFSTAEAWAVGSTSNQFISPLPLIEHWDGQQWSIVPSPQLPGLGGQLNAVAEISPENVWAVGNQFSVEVSAGVGQYDALIEHWDGRHWTIVPSPPGRRGDKITNSLSSITVVSANDIWAVGSWSEFSATEGSSMGTLFEHWNGRTWSLVPDPENQAEIRLLKDLKVVVGKQILAVGVKVGSVYSHVVFERWDGQRWQTVDTTSFVDVLSLSATSENNIWALAVEHRSGNGSQIKNSYYLEHWDGQKWSKVLSPAWLANINQYDTTESNTVLQILAMDDGSVWIIGQDYSTGSLQSFIASWNGRIWQRTNLLPSPVSNSSVHNVVSAFTVSAGAIWVVGTQEKKEGPGFSTHLLIMGQLTCP